MSVSRADAYQTAVRQLGRGRIVALVAGEHDGEPSVFAAWWKEKPEVRDFTRHESEIVRIGCLIRYIMAARESAEADGMVLA